MINEAEALRGKAEAGDSIAETVVEEGRVGVAGWCVPNALFLHGVFTSVASAVAALNRAGRLVLVERRAATTQNVPGASVYVKDKYWMHQVIKKTVSIPPNPSNHCIVLLKYIYITLLVHTH